MCALTAFDAFEVEVELDDAVVRGELLVPAAPVAAGVLFVPAGGLSDRDGNDTDVGFAPLRQLAEGLAERGIASLRSEGRGVGRSSGELASPQTALEDFLALIARCSRYPELGTRPVLLAHGAGCTLALVAATRLVDDPPAGLVLIAPPVSPVGELMGYRQAAAARLADLPPGERLVALAQLQAEYGERPALLPVSLKAISCPILVVQGTADWIFPPGESLRLVSKLPNAERLLLDGLDHWLVPFAGWRSPEQNLRSDLAVAEEAIEPIAGWIAART
ncbi:alpha/beta hydrolase [Gloeobacter kilaueensis]|uniref:alpha/beta hydrolase n=1 Tax=Gloeobacter kilaueensis TaxID=1416614 RepID=UPI001650E44E|nr:alpha/beta fold hydrolase [Gloeobacter kilaueensis]